MTHLPRLPRLSRRACLLLGGAAIGAAALRPRPAAAETITVTHWGGQFYGAPYAVAMDKGYFRSRGVDVTGILTAPGGGTAVRNTLAGGIQFGEVSLAAAVQAANAGQRIIIVSAGVQSVADQVWVARKGSPLRSIRDLAGKRVGYTAPASVSNMTLLLSLKASGMTPQQLQMVPAGDLGANLAAVIGGALDAGFIDETILAANEDKVQPVFRVRDAMSPRMMQTVCITAGEYARAHPDTIRGLIAGRREGVAYLTANPDEAADITARAYNNPNAAQVRGTFRRLLREQYWSDGRFDYDAMDRMVEGLQVTGQLKGAVDWPRLVDASYLPSDLRAAAK